MKEKDSDEADHMKHILASIKLIRATKKHSGTIVCPACEKTLYYTVAPSNGHIHAKCETDNCISYMM